MDKNDGLQAILWILKSIVRERGGESYLCISELMDVFSLFFLSFMFSLDPRPIFLIIHNR